jgi:peptide/nickel transport system substrate-binding protein
MSTNRFAANFGRALRRLFFRSSSKNEESGPELGPDHSMVVKITSPKRIPRMSQLRYARQLMSQRERRILLLSGAVLVLALLTAGGTFVSAHTSRLPAVGGNLTEAILGQPKYINPLDALANDPDRDLVKLIYSGLFRLDGLTPVPDLAESYEWSNDNKTLTVRLRQDALFHDEQPVTADDVIFTYEAILDPARKSQLAGLFRGIRLTRQDDATVVFELEKADANFLGRLTVGLLPAHLWQDLPATSARLSDLNLKPIGSGPYLVKSFTRDSLGNIHSFTLERNPKYYGDKPFIKNLVFQYYPDRQQALEAFKGNQVDAVAFLNINDLEKAGLTSRAQKIRLDLPQETLAFFNLKDKILSNKDVRQALALAIDRNETIEAFRGSAKPVSGPYPFGEVSASTTATDIELARSLLTKAGWVMPPDGNVRILETAGKTTSTSNATTTELVLDILIPEDPDLQAVAESLKRQWSLIGAKVEIRAVPMEELLRQATRERQTQIVLLNLQLGIEQDVFPFWWSGNATVRGLNISNLSDRTVDSALEATRNATTTESLASARQKLTEAIAAANPAIFLVRPIQHYLVSNRIKGIGEGFIIAEPAERFNQLTNWYAKTSWQWD